MNIQLEDRNVTGIEPFYVGTRRRLATATGVAFVTENRLAVTSLVGRRMYLIEFDLEAQTHRVVFSTATTSADGDAKTDLLSFDGNSMLAASNCDAASFSLYELRGDELSRVRDLQLKRATFCHGIEFGPRDSRLVAAASTGKDPAVHVFSLDAEDAVYVFAFDDWRPRDTGFVSSTRLVVPYARNSATGTADASGDESIVRLVELNLGGRFRRSHDVVAELAFDGSRFEGCVHRAGRVFLADQAGDRVIECSIDGDALSFVREHPGYDFPHGVDFLPSQGLLAATNYGSNTVTITKI